MATIVVKRSYMVKFFEEIKEVKRDKETTEAHRVRL